MSGFAIGEICDLVGSSESCEILGIVSEEEDIYELWPRGRFRFDVELLPRLLKELELDSDSEELCTIRVEDKELRRSMFSPRPKDAVLRFRDLTYPSLEEFFENPRAPYDPGWEAWQLGFALPNGARRPMIRIDFYVGPPNASGFRRLLYTSPMPPQYRWVTASLQARAIDHPHLHDLCTSSCPRDPVSTFLVPVPTYPLPVSDTTGPCPIVHQVFDLTGLHRCRLGNAFPLPLLPLRMFGVARL